MNALPRWGGKPGAGFPGEFSHLGSSFRSRAMICAVDSVKHFEFLVINFLSPIQSTKFAFPSLLSEVSALNKMDVGETVY